jgi:putative tryptophan/tyrosine transport system substrate-binding protein
MRLTRRVFVVGLSVALPAMAGAQDRRKIVVGFVSWWPAFMEADYVPRLRKGLASFGYVEGQNLEMLVVFTGGDRARTRETARRFVERGVDVIVATATPAVTIVKEETQAKQIPVVMAPVADPLATGLVQSIARPGGNLTGMSMAGPDLSGKRLQILRDIMPNLEAIAFLGSTRDPNTKTFAASLERVATQAGLKLMTKMVESPAQIDDTLMADLKQAGAQALVIQPIFIGQHVKIVETAQRAGLPSISDFPAFAEAGVLFTYGLDDRAGMERAAYFVDRIVKGTKPADLPIELPTAFTLVVNRKAAAAFGLSLPPNVLVQADEVIE